MYYGPNLTKEFVLGYVHSNEDKNHSGVVVNCSGQLKPEGVGENLAKEIEDVRPQRYLRCAHEPVSNAVSRYNEHPLDRCKQLRYTEFLKKASILHLWSSLHKERKVHEYHDTDI